MPLSWPPMMAGKEDASSLPGRPRSANHLKAKKPERRFRNAAARIPEQSVAQYCSVVPAMCQFTAAQERIIAETAMAD